MEERFDLRVFSHDEGLQALCREVVGDFPEQHWRVLTNDDQFADAVTRFYIWDIPTDVTLSDYTKSGLLNHLFLIDRNDLATLQGRLRPSEAYILLKPVTRAILSIYLGVAISRFQANVSEVQERYEIARGLVEVGFRLQELDHDRTSFLARGLHDFRAPLTALLGYAGLLQAGALGPVDDDQKEILQRMRHSAKRLSRMASAMFQVNRGRDDTGSSNFQDVSIRECIVQVLYETRPIADSKHISISVDLDAATPILHFDSGLMEQVLINVVENGCKFTPKGGQIKVSGGPFFWERRTLRHDGAPATERRQQNSGNANAYRLDILNSGAHIPHETLKNLFRVNAASAVATHRSAGGLGLVICRMAVEQHQGRIWAQNTDDGPVFSVILPMHPGVGQSNPPVSSNRISEVDQ